MFRQRREKKCGEGKKEMEIKTIMQKTMPVVSRLLRKLRSGKKEVNVFFFLEPLVTGVHTLLGIGIHRRRKMAEIFCLLRLSAFFLSFRFAECFSMQSGY